MMKKMAMLGVIAVIAIGVAVYLNKADRQQDVIKIGVVNPETGDFAAYGLPVKEALLLALEEINATGGIMGKRVRLIFEDDGGVPKNSVNAFQKLATRDKVQAVIGPLASQSSLATASIAVANRVIQLSTLAATPELSSSGEYVFRIYPSSTIGARFTAEEAINQFTPKSVALLHATGGAGVESAKVYEQVASEKGIRISNKEQYRDGETDFRTQLQKIKEQSPDVIFCSAYWVDGANILKQMVELGINIPIVGEDGWNGELAQLVGVEGLKFLYFSDLLFDTSDADSKAFSFTKNYQRKYNKKPTAYSATGYDALYLLKAAIESRNKPDSDSIKKFLFTETHNGVLGIFKFDENGDNTGVSMGLFQLNSANESVSVK
jgi:ABC-type branched-chain amino acid transport systems, periplasmic component